MREVFAPCTDRAATDARLPRWMSWVSRCRLPSFKWLAETVEKHLSGILEDFRSGLNNGFAEAIHRPAQAAKRRAKG